VIFLQNSLGLWFYKLLSTYWILKRFVVYNKISRNNLFQIKNYLVSVGVDSLAIVLITACFIAMVFTLQIGKEFVFLNTTSMLGPVLGTTYLRELCPVLTAVITTARIGSAFTAEIASMKVTDQIDVFLILKIDPVDYLVLPRIYSCMLVLPLLNVCSFVTSIFSSLFIASILYNISSSIFIYSLFHSISCFDIFCSSFKSLVFGFIIAIISCGWGLSTIGGSKNVGISTTSSVVTSLLLIFIIDFLFSYIMFSNSSSLFQV
jgi:phospholipid/cholesterol/gamma-HCH transport system permease protein